MQFSSNMTGPQISLMIINIFNKGTIPIEWCITNLVLIPKTNLPEIITQFHFFLYTKKKGLTSVIITPSRLNPIM